MAEQDKKLQDKDTKTTSQSPKLTLSSEKMLEMSFLDKPNSCGICAESKKKMRDKCNGHAKGAGAPGTGSGDSPAEIVESDSAVASTYVTPKMEPNPNGKQLTQEEIELLQLFERTLGHPIAAKNVNLLGNILLINIIDKNEFRRLSEISDDELNQIQNPETLLLLELFNQFKETRGIEGKNFKAFTKGNFLIVSVPNPNDLIEFMRFLMNPNNTMAKDFHNSNYKTPTPLSMEPKK